MNTVAGILGGLVVGAGIGWGVATQFGKSTGAGNSLVAGQASPATPSATAEGDSKALFRVNGQVYTEQDLPADVRSLIFEARHEAFERLQNILGQFSLQLALAKDKNKDVKLDDLPPMENLLDVQKPTDEEVKALFEANKARLPPGMTFEQVKSDIERFVTQQKTQEAMRNKRSELEAKGQVAILLEAPTAPVVELNLAGFPTKGKGSNTVVEAADYLCPHCQEFYGEVVAMTEALSDKIRLVPINYALNPEGLSGMLARGAYCALQQGDEAFWKYHATAFSTAREKQWKTSDPAAKEPLQEVGKGAGIDVAKLEACVDTPQAKEQQAAANAQMNKVGVTGTPTFFVNGRKLSIHGTNLKEAVESLLSAGAH